MRTHQINHAEWDMRIENCAFTFQCPRTWDRLEQTAEANVRFCGHCERNVHLCTTDEEWVRHTQDRHCVAVRQQIAPLGGASVGRQGNRRTDDEEMDNVPLLVSMPEMPLYNPGTEAARLVVI